MPFESSNPQGLEENIEHYRHLKDFQYMLRSSQSSLLGCCLYLRWCHLSIMRSWLRQTHRSKSKSKHTTHIYAYLRHKHTTNTAYQCRLLTLSINADTGVRTSYSIAAECNLTMTGPYLYLRLLVTTPAVLLRSPQR